MSESPFGDPPDFIKVLLGVILLLGFLYCLLILGNILAGVLPILIVVFLWLFYRLLRLFDRLVAAHERTADAQERRTRAVERRVEIAEQRDGDTRNE